MLTGHLSPCGHLTPLGLPPLLRALRVFVSIREIRVTLCELYFKYENFLNTHSAVTTESSNRK